MHRQAALQLMFIALCMAVAAGCSAVKSYPVDDPAGKSFSQKGGFYYLPKHLLRVQVYGDAKDRKVGVSSVPVQDRRMALETGLALSAFSDDTITVSYDANGFLKMVDATLVDQTGEILVEIAKILGRFRAAPPSTAVIVADISFDPFDFPRARAVNIVLAKYGVCVEVEIRPELWSPGCTKGSLRRTTYAVEAIDTNFPSKLSPGIYYRRAASLDVHVIRNGETVDLSPLPFANGESIFQVDIRRSLFVSRQTKIDFTDGALTSVKVVKPSEALAGVRLPIRIVEAFANAATGGVAKSRSAAYQGQANKDNATAQLVNVTAQQVAAGDGLATTSVIRDTVLAGEIRAAPLTAATLKECSTMGFSPEECVALAGQP